ncbi:M50 family metallopeptidase [Pueribacillus sp. YX66]|uniref:M50 family metallopeptidase n=1 Tax=Pueribacillus sp. YX66 TaxID=3229242 RepID=UPI00358CE8AC
MIRRFDIHPLTWFVIGIAILTGFFRDLVVLIAIILIHELGHYTVARFFNWRVRRIVLLPFGGVAEVDEHGNRPFKEELLVVLFGPLQHLWLIGIGFCFVYFSVWSPAFFETFLAYNLMILIFNLLPIWPLDGGKLLFLLFAYFRPFKKAHLSILAFSFLFLISFALVSVITFQTHLNVVIILVFLLLSLYTEYRHHYYVFLRFLLERLEKKTGGRRNKSLAVHPNEQIENVLKMFQKGVHHTIVTHRHCKDERELLEAYFIHKKIKTTVRQLFRLE